LCVFLHLKSLIVGTYKLVKEDVAQPLRIALQEGYRSIDTAAVYRNEEEIGGVLREKFSSGEFVRKDLYVTSKLAPKDQGYRETLAACQQSLDNLGLDYLDLYLIHWPGKQGVKPESPENVESRRESWRAMEELCESGKIRAIGVSNYTVRHLEELLASSPRIPPAVNQVEFHPWFSQRELLPYCRAKGIHLQAYSSLGRGEKLSKEMLAPLASKYGKTPAQILLRWGLQHGCAVVPKSARRERISENFQVFDFQLTPEEMALLDSAPEEKKTSWDPETIL